MLPGTSLTKPSNASTPLASPSNVPSLCWLAVSQLPHLLSAPFCSSIERMPSPQTLITFLQSLQFYFSSSFFISYLLWPVSVIFEFWISSPTYFYWGSLPTIATFLETSQILTLKQEASCGNIFLSAYLRKLFSKDICVFRHLRNCTVFCTYIWHRNNEVVYIFKIP